MSYAFVEEGGPPPKRGGVWFEADLARRRSEENPFQWEVAGGFSRPPAVCIPSLYVATSLRPWLVLLLTQCDPHVVAFVHASLRHVLQAVS